MFNSRRCQSGLARKAATLLPHQRRPRVGKMSLRLAAAPVILLFTLWANAHEVRVEDCGTTSKMGQHAALDERS